MNKVLKTLAKLIVFALLITVFELVSRVVIGSISVEYQFTAILVFALVVTFYYFYDDDKKRVKIKLLSDSAIIPKKATNGAAAYDLYAPKDYRVECGRHVMPLDIALEIPYGYEAHIQSRSGLASKGFIGCIIQNGEKYRFDCDVLEGKIDSDYRGCIGIILNNHDKNFWITKGDRIAQLTIRKVEDVDFVEVNELGDTERGTGGFGHTGV